MLREYRRTWDYFTYLDGRGDEKFQKLDMSFVSALSEEYGMKVWAYDIIDSELSPDSIVPEKVVDRYLRCNEYCARFMLKKKKKR
jgi:hypothetical protein